MAEQFFENSNTAGNSDPVPYGDLPLERFVESVFGDHSPRGFGLDVTRRDDRTEAVEEVDLLTMPFCKLRHFRCASDSERPKLLLVAPLAGQYPELLRDTVRSLLPHFAVHVTAWIDARQVPPDAGAFDLDANIATVIECLHALGPEVHLLAVCQSAVPTLAAVALMAAAEEPDPPLTLVLMGGLIDTRISPTRMDLVARSLSLPWIESSVISPVPAEFPGAGRRVYPARAQRAALLLYLARHVITLAGAPPRVRIHGDAVFADPAVLRDLLTLMDVPAELFVQNIRSVLQEHALPRGRMRWRGRSVEPAAIARTALMTVEGAFDDISGRGQTRAAHDLCSGIPAGKRDHHEQPGVGHFGMYIGDHWRNEVLPRLLAFVHGQR